MVQLNDEYINVLNQQLLMALRVKDYKDAVLFISKMVKKLNKPDLMYKLNRTIKNDYNIPLHELIRLYHEFGDNPTGIIRVKVKTDLTHDSELGHYSDVIGDYEHTIKIESSILIELFDRLKSVIWDIIEIVYDECSERGINLTPTEAPEDVKNMDLSTLNYI